MGNRENFKTRLSRRQILAMSGSLPAVGFLANPIKQIISSILEGIVYDAHARTEQYGSNASPRRYIYFTNFGAPPRWYFDLPLNPFSSGSELVRNPCVNTRFGDDGRLTYETAAFNFAGKTINMPYLWKCDIPTSDQGWVPMANLLKNMLIIRGIDMVQDGHSANSIRMTNPSSSAASLGGAVADRTDTPIPAIYTPSAQQLGYRSGNGVGQTRVTFGSPPLQQLLSPFIRGSTEVTSDWLNRRQAMESAVQGALASLCKYAESANPGANSICIDRSRAEKLLKQGLGDLTAIYNQLKSKYDSLIRRCLDENHKIPGITDKPVLASSFPSAQKTVSVLNLQNSISNSDLTSILDPVNTTIKSMAESFAVTEYVICNGFSSTVLTGFDEIQNLNYQNLMNTTSGDSTNISAVKSWGTDEHIAGAATSLIANSFRFRAFSACLYELIRALNVAGIFNETVIQFGAEFNRSPKSNGGGGDHGWRANVTSIFSGVIQGLEVIGNTKVSNDTSYPGSWGVAASGKVDGADVPIGVGHVTSTVAHLLRVKPPMENNMSLVRETGSGISLTTDSAVNK